MFQGEGSVPKTWNRSVDRNFFSTTRIVIIDAITLRTKKKNMMMTVTTRTKSITKETSIHHKLPHSNSGY